ncbi:hypothetical protein [Bacillus sp. BHET2]|uniref:hypothetical protein n=1 Tax=Bacillus sp. BHET2 TaxID=2583818 RepID=UPI001486B847|nr:hypothetical protein [Bacillus sp. BHET2]
MNQIIKKILRISGFLLIEYGVSSLEPIATTSTATVVHFTSYVVITTATYSSTEIFSSNISSNRNSKVVVGSTSHVIVSTTIRRSTYVVTITIVTHSLTSLTKVFALHCILC